MNFIVQWGVALIAVLVTAGIAALVGHWRKERRTRRAEEQRKLEDFRGAACVWPKECQCGGPVPTIPELIEKARQKVLQKGDNNGAQSDPRP